MSRASVPSVNLRIGSILDDGEGNVEERLYSEFVGPYENKEPLDRAVPGWSRGSASSTG